MTADDLTVMDMLSDMSDAEFAEFAHDNRDKIREAIFYGHHARGGPNWDDELDKHQQAVRDGEAEARHQDRVFQESKGVL